MLQFENCEKQSKWLTTAKQFIEGFSKDEW